MERTAASSERTAVRPGPVEERARALLEGLHHHIPFDAAWMALADGDGARYSTVASSGLDDVSVGFLRGSRVTHHAPSGPSSTACPPAAGFREALSVVLCADGHRSVGLVTVLFRSATPPSETTRRRLARFAPALASGIDPVRSLAATVAWVSGVESGVVLLADHGIVRIPGLSDDELLTTGSDLVDAARDAICEGQEHASFLWPRGSRQSPDAYARVTVLAGEADLSTVACGVVVLAPATDLRGLTPRELEVLGHVIEGCSNLEIARALAIAPRTVAAHIEHILLKLDATSRTLAAVRAERAGLYVPLSAARSV